MQHNHPADEKSAFIQPNDSKQTPGVNYLSYEYQRSYISQFLESHVEKLDTILGDQIGSEAKKSEVSPKTFESMHDDILRAARHGLVQICRAHFKKIKTDQIAQENKCEKNNVLLMELLTQVQRLFENANALLEKTYRDFKIPLTANTNDEAHQLLMKIAKSAGFQKKYLKKAIDIQIYQVELSTPEFNEFYMKSKTFYFDKKAVGAVMKRAGGDTLAGVTVVGLAMFNFTVIPMAIDSYFFNQRGSKFLTNVVNKGSDIGDQGKAGMGFKQNIPAACIVGRVIGVDKSGEPIIEKNPNFKEKKDGAVTRLFTIHAVSPEAVFQHGTNYHEIGTSNNTHSHALLIDTVELAQQCIIERSSGEWFDAIAGERLNNKWKDEERAAVYQRYEKTDKKESQPKKS